MKRILYFSRESPFISERQDSLLNNPVNDAQPIHKNAVDSDRLDSSENKPEVVAVDANGFILLAEIELPVEAKMESAEYIETRDKQNLEQNNIRALVDNKAISHLKKQDVTATIKSVLLANKEISEVKKQNLTYDNSALSTESKIGKAQELLVESTDSVTQIEENIEAESVLKSDLGDSVLEIKDLSEKDKQFLELEALKNEVISLEEKKVVKEEVFVDDSQDKEVLDSPPELLSIEKSEIFSHEKSLKDSSLKESGSYNTISLNTTESVLKEVAENNLLSAKKEQLPENIVINVDAKTGSYSAPEHLEVAYKTIELSHSEADKADGLAIRARNKSAHTENLIIKEVIRSSNEVSTRDVQKSEILQKSSLKLGDINNLQAEETFDPSKYFKEESQALAYKGVVDLSENASKEPEGDESEAIGTFEKKIELPVNTEVVSVEDEKVILSELDSKLDDQEIIFFSGVNSGLEDKISKDPLDNIFSFESKILKGLGKKEKNISDQAEVKKEQNVSNKIKPLQLFDTVVKKLTSNHQQSNDEFLAQNNIDDVEYDISLDRIRDTYQRIFSEYK